MREKRIGSGELKSLRARVEALKSTGVIAWSGRQLRPAKPVGRVRGDKTVADLIVENRETCTSGAEPETQ